jgi:oligopeptide/dipeptide ABC transporter ATP-binding protein
VRHIAGEVMVMYLGRVVEHGPKATIFERPRHPYTRALLAAAPRLEPGRQLGGGILEGEPPSPRKLPSGCAFRTRCPHAAPHCADVVPVLEPAASGHDVACLRWREIASASPTPQASSGVVPKARFQRDGRGSG